jgi:threonine dehydrogenase-like Zn-dependent dehydrogenase
MKAPTWHGEGEIAASFVITHRAVEQGPELYKSFRGNTDGCIKVVMKSFRA